MSKTSKAERLELYKDRDTQALLSKFLNDEIRELQPTFSSSLTYSYPLVEAIVGDASRAEAFLHKLYEAGILERKIYDKVIYCPKCSSPNVSVRHYCPHCKSFDIQKGSLIEHVKCGYMDVEDNFHKDGKLICPKCHEELKKPDIDHRRAGVWCTCRDCGKSFDIPIASYFCRGCQGDFTFEEVVIKNVYSYGLRSEAKNEATLGWVLISPIKELLTKEGFKVESPGFLTGKSGASHLFDVVARKGTDVEKVTVMDLATASEGVISEQPVIALFAKIFDVSPDNAYLVAMPKMSEDGKKMAQLYKIQIIEARNEKEVTKTLKDKISYAEINSV
jgi:transcription elongation factor Elf1